MNTTRLLILCCTALIVTASYGQDDRSGRQRDRRDKIEAILRIQDSRSIHDGKLLKFLSDRDPVVRERAVRAFGSIQDTGVINLLVEHLADRNPAVATTAAFAIGQTAPLLSTPSRHKLRQELIWQRLEDLTRQATEPDNPAAGRLIEEIGKFGDEQGLDDLVLKFGNSYPRRYVVPLTMCIARSAIRNVVSGAAVGYLLQFIRTPDTTPWEVVYALQRIGARDEVRQEMDKLVALTRHGDPRIRMHTAALLGKLRDAESSLESLRRLAESDRDWRVRVNAIRALGLFPLERNPAVIDLFRTWFMDGNDHVGMTAIAVFGSIAALPDSGKEVTGASRTLERIVRNEGGGYFPYLQGEAAVALARRRGEGSLDVLLTVETSNRQLRGRLIEAIAATGSSRAVARLAEYAGGSDPWLAGTALEGMRTLCERNPSDSLLRNTVYDAAITSLRIREMELMTTAASILGDSLLLRRESVPHLLEALRQLRVPNDIEAMLEIIATLGTIRDMTAVPALQRELESPDRSVAHAAAAALRSIQGENADIRMPDRRPPLFTDYDFTYLRSLPDTVHVKLETIRGDVFLELYPREAPFTVMSFLKLAADRGYFRGLVFHRIVPNFVVQGGDPRGSGWGGPGYTIRSEFSLLTYDEGVLGMASAGKDTEGSQFFVTQSPQPHLDGRYTIFGRVVSGMDVVNRLQVGDRMYDVKVVER